MEKSNLNVIIFDEQDSSISHTPSARHQKPTNEIIHQQLQVLSQKIRHLQQQTNNLGSMTNDSNAFGKSAPSEAHSQHILMVIEKKIQIIVRETKKIVDKLGDNFEKKIQSKLSKKFDQAGIAKVKKNYAQSLKNIEQNYKKQINRLAQGFKAAQNKMIGQVTAMQQKLNNKINDFSIKEKEYVDWIHHLQLQLEEKTQKKKMIQVTQDKGNRNSVQVSKGSEHSTHLLRGSQHSSIVTNPNENYSNIHFGENNVQNQRNHSPVNQDNSRIQKRRKIFDKEGNGNNKGSSVSPNHAGSQSQSQAQPYFHSIATVQSSKVISPATFHQSKAVNPATFQPTKAVNPSNKPKVNDSRPGTVYETQPVISLATRAAEPLMNNTNLQNQSSPYSPWRVIDKSIQKSYAQGTKRQNMVKDVNQDDFYRDLPKANQGWERFQGFNPQDESSDSDQEVMFYRQEDRKEPFLENFRSSKSPKNSQEKVFSPFDLS